MGGIRIFSNADPGLGGLNQYGFARIEI